MKHGAGARTARRWRVLLAHDTNASACDHLIGTLNAALGSVEVCESSSVDDALLALDFGRFDLSMICLDLPPAPRGGVRLAQQLIGADLPLILVTRSLWWIPSSAAALRALPWIAPDAAVTQVSRAVAEAMATPHQIHRIPVESGQRFVGTSALPVRQAAGE